MEKFNRLVPGTMTITPKGVIFAALGGYQNKEANELAEKVNKALADFMAAQQVDMVVVRSKNQKSIRFLGKNE